MNTYLNDNTRYPWITPLQEELEKQRVKYLVNADKSSLIIKSVFNFSEILNKLKKGYKFKRKDWNFYIQLSEEKVPEYLYKTLTTSQKNLLNNFITNKGEVYTLTKDDILAEDWEIETFEISSVIAKYQENSVMKEYNVNYTVQVLGYEKTYTIPVKSEDPVTAQKLVLEDELHNADSKDILPQKNNKELFEVDDIDFIYRVNWVQEIK